MPKKARKPYSGRARDRLTDAQITALPSIITCAEAAGIAGVSDQTVKRWARNGYVLGSKAGALWRFNKQSVLDYCNGSAR